MYHTIQVLYSRRYMYCQAVHSVGRVHAMARAPGLKRSSGPATAGTVGVFAISVAAERADLQIQNLRVYERRGLLRPDRTDGGTRLYSEADIEVLRRIAELLREGLNLAGIARVLALENEVARLRGQLAGP